MEIEGKIALVTGAGAGLGRELATGLARAGAHALHDDVSSLRGPRPEDGLTPACQRNTSTITYASDIPSPYYSSSCGRRSPYRPR